MPTPLPAPALARPLARYLAQNESILADLLATFITAQFDPHTVSFAGIDECGVRVAARAIPLALEHPVPLSRAINRNQFLAACLDYTMDSPVEHLLVGLGQKHGTTTKIDRVMHAVGTIECVELSPAVLIQIEAHYRSHHEAEVVVFHNHPRNALNAALDNLPTASATDRRLLLTFYAAVGHLLKSATGGGRVRFFLGENESVAEFTQPHWLDLLRTMEARGVR